MGFSIARSQSHANMGIWRLTLLLLFTVVVLSEPRRSRHRDSSGGRSGHRTTGNARSSDHGGSHPGGKGLESSQNSGSSNSGNMGNTRGNSVGRRPYASHNDGNTATDHHGENEGVEGSRSKDQRRRQWMAVALSAGARPARRRYRHRRRRRTSTTSTTSAAHVPTV